MRYIKYLTHPFINYIVQHTNRSMPGSIFRYIIIIDFVPYFRHPSLPLGIMCWRMSDHQESWRPYPIHPTWGYFAKEMNSHHVSSSNYKKERGRGMS